mmetsp:Transcript_115381/g.230060  ORF Transcript_115381/g.230060 Transcript_115381/m.230060 type:complete len:580 (-) Transcript_115381:82-1821(-)
MDHRCVVEKLRRSQWPLLLAVTFSAASAPIGVNAAGTHGRAGQTGMAGRVQSLPFSVLDPPRHLMIVDVGVFFEHLFAVNSFVHSFDADFWLVYRWHDPRNYSTLFNDNPLVQVEEEACTVPNKRGGDEGNRLLQSARHLAAPGTRYLELDHDKLPLFWQPDLHIRNLGRSGTKLYAEFARVYEDGTFEFLRLLYANLGLSKPYYGAYPFDHQTLTVQVESLAHTKKQIQIRVLESFSGLDFEYTSEWPGWSPVEGGIKFATEEQIPHYIYEAGNSHRCERRSRYHLDIKVKRHISTIVDNMIVPLVMQVVITWTAFFINVKVLMPRVAVAFISYLTLNNAAASLSAGLPPVSHAMFINNVVLVQRLMVVVGLFETASTSYITECISTRVGMSLDKLARVFVPLDYVVCTIIIFIMGSSGMEDHKAYETKLLVLEYLAWGNFLFVFVVGALWCAYQYRFLRQHMIRDPLRLHMSATHKPLDSNEVGILFHVLDKVTDKKYDSIIKVKDMVMYVLKQVGQKEVLDSCDDIVAAVLEKIPGKRDTLSLEEFITHHKPIMVEIAHWYHGLNFRDHDEVSTED